MSSVTPQINLGDATANGLGGLSSRQAWQVFNEHEHTDYALVSSWAASVLNFTELTSSSSSSIAAYQNVVVVNDGKPLLFCYIPESTALPVINEVYAPVDNVGRWHVVQRRLEVAAPNRLGLVRPDGVSIVIQENGVMSAATVARATSDTLGKVRPDGNTTIVDSAGVITATAFSATAQTLGHVKPDNLTIEISESGVLSTINEPATDLLLGHVKPDGITTQIDPQGRIKVKNALSLGTLSLDQVAAPSLKFGTGTLNPPTIATRSEGTRLLLNPTLGATLADFGIGVETNALWLGVADTTSEFKFYSKNTNIASLNGSGALNLSGGLTSLSVNTGSLINTGTASIAGKLSIGSLSNTYPLGYRNLAVNGSMYYNPYGIFTKNINVAGGQARAGDNYLVPSYYVYKSAGGTNASQTWTNNPAPGIKASLTLQRIQGNAGTDAINCMQVIEPLNFYHMAGKPIVFSLKIRKGTDFSASGSLAKLRLIFGTTTVSAGESALLASNGGWAGYSTLTQDATISSSSEFNRYFITAVVPTNATQCAMQVSYVPSGVAGANDKLEITEFQLENELAPTLFETESIAQSLIRSQRYYETFGFFVSFGAVSSWVYMPVIFKTQKRAISGTVQPDLVIGTRYNVAGTTFYPNNNAGGTEGSYFTVIPAAPGAIYVDNYVTPYSVDF